MHTMSKFDLLVAAQACMIYLIMCVVDYEAENEGSGIELLLTLHVSIGGYRVTHMAHRAN